MAPDSFLNADLKSSQAQAQQAPSFRPGGADTSARFRLRSATADAHGRLDRAVSEGAAFESEAGYRRYLAGQYIFRASLEAHLAGLPLRGLTTWQCEPLAALIAQDLLDLGQPRPTAVAAVDAVLRDALQAPASDAAGRGHLLGIAYVLEGSRLGAQLLWRRAQALGFGGRHGARHLASQVATREPWLALVATLDTLEPPEEAAAIASARAAFLAAEHAFTGAIDAA